MFDHLKTFVVRFLFFSNVSIVCLSILSWKRSRQFRKKRLVVREKAGLESKGIFTYNYVNTAEQQQSENQESKALKDHSIPVICRLKMLSQSSDS